MRKKLVVDHRRVVKAQELVKNKGVFPTGGLPHLRLARSTYRYQGQNPDVEGRTVKEATLEVVPRSIRALRVSPDRGIIAP